MAVAVEQENRARVEEMRARVVEAEAEVPLAMAEAFRSGNLGIMDYARYRNLQSDTQMRESIAKPDGSPEGAARAEPMDWFTLLLLFIFFVLPLIQQIAEARKRSQEPEPLEPEEWEMEEEPAAERSGPPRRNVPESTTSPDSGSWSEGGAPGPVRNRSRSRCRRPRHRPYRLRFRLRLARKWRSGRRPSGRSGPCPCPERRDRCPCPARSGSCTNVPFRWIRYTWIVEKPRHAPGRRPGPGRCRSRCTARVGRPPRWVRRSTTARSCGARCCWPRCSDRRAPSSRWRRSAAEPRRARSGTNEAGEGRLRPPFSRSAHGDENRSRALSRQTGAEKPSGNAPASHRCRSGGSTPLFSRCCSSSRVAGFFGGTGHPVRRIARYRPPYRRIGQSAFRAGRAGRDLPDGRALRQLRGAHRLARRERRGQQVVLQYPGDTKCRFRKTSRRRWRSSTSGWRAASTRWWFPTPLVEPPPEPGIWNVVLRARGAVRGAVQAGAERERDHYRTRHRASSDGYIGDYRIGNWPAGQTGAYAAPRGFVRVTPENMNMHVSRHFQLKDFLTKGQEGCGRSTW
jgi:hypothetical protein